ncbi:protein NETWORKED 4A-like [Papaver somniferum]|uniref:protein NETWORKED 4A-like n=1 Tax=Papaver somniferum TaxID=3469 RepID=UPI000E6FA90C|nr:protein NETWORKED 4A-like [Papaver somniferum]
MAASDVAPHDKKALCLFLCIWTVYYSRFQAVGYSFVPCANFSSSTFTWTSCWSTMYIDLVYCNDNIKVAIVMSSKTMKRLVSNISHSWWFGSLDTTEYKTSHLVLELQQRMVRLRLELERNKSSDGVTNDASWLASTGKKGLEAEAWVRDEKLRISEEEEVAWLKHELDRTKSYLKVIEAQATELKVENRMLEMDACKRGIEIRDLKLAISDANLRFINENAQLHKVILALEQGHVDLETTLKTSEMRVHKLVEEYKKLEGEYIEFRVLQRNRAEEMDKYLIAKIVERGNWVDENLLEKANFDAMRVEINELNAKVSSSATDLETRDEKICQMEEHLDRLHMEHVELISRCEAATKYAAELKKKLSQMERQVEWQRGMIIEGEEKKREAIRQLSFSLEHFKNRYYEFREAFILLKRKSPLLDIAYYYRK